MQVEGTPASVKNCSPFVEIYDRHLETNGKIVFKIFKATFSFAFAILFDATYYLLRKLFKKKGNQLQLKIKCINFEIFSFQVRAFAKFITLSNLISCINEEQIDIFQGSCSLRMRSHA